LSPERDTEGIVNVSGEELPATHEIKKAAECYFCCLRENMRICFKTLKEEEFQKVQ
jgi:hypothetical protein